MKILHLSASPDGGAGMAAQRLHKGLIGCGIESEFFSRNNAGITPYRGISGLKRKIRDCIDYRFKHVVLPERLKNKIEAFHDIYTQFKEEGYVRFMDVSLINLHWIADFIDYPSFFHRFANRIPLVWTLHDMNPFLGGCHYRHDTDFLSREIGGGLPLKHPARHDPDSIVWSRKKKIYERIRTESLTIVTPSRWLKSEVEKSSLMSRFDIACIPNGVNANILKPADKAMVREIFNISRQAKTVLFCADSIHNRRKGYDILLQAIDRLSEDIVLLAVGKTERNGEIDRRIRHLGSFNNEFALAAAYSAADAFIIPAREDNFPNTILESMACGTPVLGANVGGIPETVRRGMNGLLFEPDNADDLAQKVTEFFNLPESKRKEMGQNARETVVKEYDLPIQAHAYIKLYEELLERR
jgi:glycosyltransferase involved in cell wall biosynthesis